jgi:hypothetical protein
MIKDRHTLTPLKIGEVFNSVAETESIHSLKIAETELITGSNGKYLIFFNLKTKRKIIVIDNLFKGLAYIRKDVIKKLIM